MKRVTDVVLRAQPPLKDKFQSTFQMTLLGNALLARLWDSRRYRALPFSGGRVPGEVIEVYPGATLRQMGLTNYKSKPEEAIRLAIGACAAAGITLDVDLRRRRPAREGPRGRHLGAKHRRQSSCIACLV